MKKLIFFVAFLSLVGISRAQTSAVYCVQVNCPITITAPTDSALIFSATTLSGDTVAAYQWKQISGPTTAILVTPAASQTVVRKLSPGTYTFSLTVTTKHGAVLPSTMDQVSVAPQPAAPRTVVKISFQLINGVWTPSIVYSDGSTQ